MHVAIEDNKRGGFRFYDEVPVFSSNLSGSSQCALLCILPLARADPCWRGSFEGRCPLGREIYANQNIQVDH